jgi:hypothetical protein
MHFVPRLGQTRDPTGMVSAAFYRREAQRCRASAVAAHDPASAVRWLRIAGDYDRLADALMVEEQRLSPPLLPMQAHAKLPDS